MKKRHTQAPIQYALPRADDPSQAVDAAWFRQHPDQRTYCRKYIRGETVKPMHPDTWVRVIMINGERVRGFAPPLGGLN